MIILVRHGEATHHTLKLTGGWTDSELTPKGEAQLEAAAARLAEDFEGHKVPLRILADIFYFYFLDSLQFLFCSLESGIFKLISNFIAL